jgi:hypothetical protein
MAKVSKPRATHAVLAQKAQARRQAQRRLWWGIGGVLLLAIIVGGIFIFLRRGNTNEPTAQTLDSNGQIIGLQTFTNLSRDHQTGTLTYDQTPPVGGAHNPVWQNCGIYAQPIGNENAVHSMEHGAVWITYRPDLPATDVEKLRSLVRGHQYIVLSPYPNLPAPVVASAWGLQVKMTSAADPRIRVFISKYENGPQTPEPGATCTGGNGTPSE